MWRIQDRKPSAVSSALCRSTPTSASLLVHLHPRPKDFMPTSRKRCMLWYLLMLEANEACQSLDRYPASQLTARVVGTAIIPLHVICTRTKTCLHVMPWSRHKADHSLYHIVHQTLSSRVCTASGAEWAPAAAQSPSSARTLAASLAAARGHQRQIKPHLHCSTSPPAAVPTAQPRSPLFHLFPM